MAAREKYENTSKAKSKADTIAQQILTQNGYNALKAKVAPTAKPKVTPTPTAKPKVTNSTISKGEAEFIKALKNGKTLAEARKMIISKYGFSPNGRTN